MDYATDTYDVEVWVKQEGGPQYVATNCPPGSTTTPAWRCGPSPLICNAKGPTDERP